MESSHQKNIHTYIEKEVEILSSYFANTTNPLLVEGEFGQDKHLESLVDRYTKDTQLKILKKTTHKHDVHIYYTIDAKHIVRDKQLGSPYISFEKYILKELAMISAIFTQKAKIIIHLPDAHFIPPHLDHFEQIIETQGYEISHHSDEIPYTIKEAAILASYEAQNQPKSLLQHNNITTQRSQLSTDKKTQDYLRLLAQAYFHGSELPNISCFTYSIERSQQSVDAAAKLINKRLETYKKLLLSGYVEEEDVQLINNIADLFIKK